MSDREHMVFLGKRIREARIEAGFTQEQLAEGLMVSRSAVARYEKGDIEPSVPILMDISKQLRISTDYLLGLSDRKNEHLQISGEEKRILRKLSDTITEYLQLYEN